MLDLATFVLFNLRNNLFFLVNFLRFVCNWFIDKNSWLFGRHLLFIFWLYICNRLRLGLSYRWKLSMCLLIYLCIWQLNSYVGMINIIKVFSVMLVRILGLASYNMLFNELLSIILQFFVFSRRFDYFWRVWRSFNCYTVIWRNWFRTLNFLDFVFNRLFFGLLNT